MSNWGWNFIVYTQDLPGNVDSNETLSGFLLDELPDRTLTKRIADPLAPAEGEKNTPWAARIAHRLLGKSSLGWGLNVFWRGMADLRTLDVDLIFAVTPPFTNALTALLLAAFAGKPLVLDLKDDWVGSPTFLQKNIMRQRIERLLEYLIVRRSSAVITVTPQSYEVYKRRYLHLQRPEKFQLIPNGCDLEEYERLTTRTRTIESDRFLILSAAWGYRKDYRDITPFLLALGRFFESRAEARAKTEVVLLGDSLSSEYNDVITQLKLEDLIKAVGTVKREELVEWLWKADLFLLVQPVNNITAISGTLYEYWATGKAPVLLVSAEGASSALVEENRIGMHFRFDQVPHIAEYIERTFDSYMRGQPVWIERAGVQSFDRKTLAKRMDEIWRKVIAASEE